MMNIIIFGFSGSGKSTLADLIGEKYGLKIIHPSSILRNLCEGKKVDIKNTKANNGFWESESGVRLFKSRLKELNPLDLVSDRILLWEIEKGGAVIDSWSLPWLTNNGIKIYLKTSLEIRAKRVAGRSKISYEKALDIIKMKDGETRRLFKRLYNFDIKKDHNVFDCVIKTDELNIDEVFRQLCDFIEMLKL